MSFGFRQPYQILVDSEMCKDAITHKIDLEKQLHNVVQGEVRLMITQCCIHELYLQGKSQQPAIDLAKSFERRKCNHREAIPGEECLQNMIGDDNKHRYIIATQSHSLRVGLREIPATPLVHLTRSVMVLEPISDVTLRAKENKEELKLHATAPELASTPVEPARKRKGPKGPNPLSVKKKKSSLVSGRQQPITQTTIPDSRLCGRKRSADDDGSDRGAGNSDNVGVMYASGKKRKRRKKAVVEIEQIQEKI